MGCVERVGRMRVSVKASGGGANTPARSIPSRGGQFPFWRHEYKEEEKRDKDSTYIILRSRWSLLGREKSIEFKDIERYVY